jgi:predicted transglutaminase-like protease
MLMKKITQSVNSKSYKSYKFKDFIAHSILKKLEMQKIIKIFETTNIRLQSTNLFEDKLLQHNFDQKIVRLWYRYSN